MRTIIAGSRTITDYSVVANAIEESGFKITKVVSGMAKGVDKLGEIWAHNNNVPVILCPADWEKHGKSAGYKRNIEMADLADALIVIIENNSRGSSHMLAIAKDRGLEVFEKRLTSLA